MVHLAAHADSAFLALALLAPLAAAAAVAVQQLPYGGPLPLEAARKAAMAATAEGAKNGWTVAAAVVDTGGHLVYFERLDGTQSGSMNVAVEKARTAASFKRPSKAFEDAVAGGKSQYLVLPGAVPIEGGLPLVLDGKVVGAIGVSGATSQQDGVCSLAGAAAISAVPPSK